MLEREEKMMKIPTNASWAELWRGGNWAHVTRKPELDHVLPVLLTCFASKYQTVQTDGKYSLQLRTSWISHEVQPPLNIKQSDGKYMGGVKFSLHQCSEKRRSWMSHEVQLHLVMFPNCHKCPIAGACRVAEVGAERAFANFRDKKTPYFTIAIFTT